METSNTSLLVFPSRIFSSVLVSDINVYWTTIRPFEFNKSAVIAVPTPPDGPQYRTNTHGDPGKLTAILRNINQQYHSNYANSEISPVCIVTTVSETLLFRSYVSWVVLYCIIASSSVKFSQSTFRVFFYHFLIYTLIGLLHS